MTDRNSILEEAAKIADAAAMPDRWRDFARAALSSLLSQKGE
jgi:hypothetical protein